MPRVSEHLAQAVHNVTFSQAVDQALFADWAITSRFYSAVHLIRAWLAAHGVAETRMNTHTKVAEQVERLGLDGQIQTAYRDLETLSRQARYDCYPLAELGGDIETAQDLYDEIKDHIVPLISVMDSLRRPPA